MTQTERKGLTHLGVFAGHNFYRAEDFGENTKERYLGYMGLLQQYDKNGIIKDDITEFVNATIKLSEQDKHKDVHTYLHYLNSYIQLEYSNDKVFNLVNYFLFVDDEPIDTISLKHTDIKKNLYKENTEVQLFFCECFNILTNKPEDYIQGFKIWEFIRSRATLITELAFFNAINKANLL